MSSHSQFLGKARKKEIRNQMKKYQKRINSLDPDHDLNIPVEQYAKDNPNPVSRVYTWGLACYGALGNPNLVIPKKGYQSGKDIMKKPVRCSAVEMLRVQDIACGYGFTVFASNDSKNQLYGTGLNMDGQLGYHAQKEGHPCDVLINPTPVTLPKKCKVARVSAGRSHTLALTTDGDVFSMGNNAYGQCGRIIIENEDYFHSKVIHEIAIDGLNKGDKIVDVTCGMDHSIFRTKLGKLYSCGWGADGQTGLGHNNNQGKPSRILGEVTNENITKVSGAADCMLALNDKGEVYGWGNSEYGQFQTVTDEQQLSVPTKLDLGKTVGKVIDIASGGTICMVLNESHDVFVWGYGILGKGPNLEHTISPSMIPSTLFGRNEFNPDVKTASVFCGLGANAALNSNGELFAWGKNRSSCLGLGDERDQYFPLRVNCGLEIKKVSLGVDHSCALAKPWF